MKAVKIITAALAVIAYVVTGALVIWLLVGGLGMALFALSHQTPH